MKKLLVASTALVAVAAVSSANAADPIKLNLGGYMNQYVGYTDQDEDGAENYAEININSETEVYFRGSTKLDNGLTVGVNIDAYADRGDSFGGDDVFLQVSGDNLGKLRIGQTKGAAYALSHKAPSAGLAVNDGDIEDWIQIPGGTNSTSYTGATGVNFNQTMTANESNDGQKLVYWTPNFGGFTAGLSYGLDINSTALESSVDVGGNNQAADTAFDAGIAYNGEFGGVKVGADVTYQKTMNGGVGAGTGSGISASAIEDEAGIRGGVSVGVAGFTFGGSYININNQGNLRDVDASGWDVGVQYATGPYAVSFTYAKFEEDDSAAAGAKEDSNEFWAIGGSYDLGAGVKLVGSVFGAEFDDASATATNSVNDNEGFGVVAGLRVSF